MAGHVREAIRKPFTLVEVISVLVLAGILSALAGMSLGRFSERFVQVSDALEASQKVSLCLTRLRKELTYVQYDGSAADLTVPAAHTVSYTSLRDGTTHTISWDGTAGGFLLLDGDALLDDIGAFSAALDGTTGELAVVLRVTAFPTVDYILRVFP